MFPKNLGLVGPGPFFQKSRTTSRSSQISKITHRSWPGPVKMEFWTRTSQNFEISDQASTRHKISSLARTRTCKNFQISDWTRAREKRKWWSVNPRWQISRCWWQTPWIGATVNLIFLSQIGFLWIRRIQLDDLFMKVCLWPLICLFILIREFHIWDLF